MRQHARINLRATHEQNDEEEDDKETYGEEDEEDYSGTDDVDSPKRHPRRASWRTAAYGRGVATQRDPETNPGRDCGRGRGGRDNTSNTASNESASDCDGRARDRIGIQKRISKTGEARGGGRGTRREARPRQGRKSPTQ